MIIDNKQPYIIYSLLTEEKGHLLIDDSFWFRNLIEVNSDTTIYTSVTSIIQLKKRFPNRTSKFVCLQDFPLLKKINYRLFIIARALWIKPVKNSRVIIQAFDEVSIFFLLWKLLRGNNEIGLVLTNNISPERLERSPRLLKFILNIIFNKCDKIFYHTDFEFEVIKRIISNDNLLDKFYKIKYHLLGLSSKPRVNCSTNSQTISFFGPTMRSKPLDSMISLILTDVDGVFKYKFLNINIEDERVIKEKTGDLVNMTFQKGYMTTDSYLSAIQSSKYVFLPHNFLFEGKLSGILSDCIANSVPIISDMIEPVIELFNNYGQMGYMYSYLNDRNWGSRFFDSQSKETYQGFKRSMEKCRIDHSEEIIIKEVFKAFD